MLSQLAQLTPNGFPPVRNLNDHQVHVSSVTSLGEVLIEQATGHHLDSFTARPDNTYQRWNNGLARHQEGRLLQTQCDW